MDILVIDDAKGLEQENYYRDYPYVRCVEADIINDKAKIYAEVSSFVDAHIEDTSILILSNDKVPTDELDANALTYLLYMQDIANQKARAIPNFDREKIDIIVYSVVNSIKITFPRKNISGSLADNDIYGCQQHMPLANIEI